MENEIKQKKNAVIYCRVSTKEQVEEGNSLVTQEKICKEYCFKNSYAISQIFLEEGESAKTAKRTQLTNLLAFCAIKKNNIHAIIVYKIDRLSRNTDDYSHLRIMFKRYGVEIKSTSENFEDSPVGRFMENTMANIAQFDNDIRTERCIGGMKEAMQEGRYVWAAPVGYINTKILGKSTIKIDPSQGYLIQEAFQIVAQGKISIEETRRFIVDKGLTMKSGRPISRSHFYRILCNPIYAGWIVKFGERQRGLFEALVSENLYALVQHILKERNIKHSIHITDHPDFPLRRFVTSAEGRKLTGSWSKGKRIKYAYYRFPRKNFRKKELESQFADFMDLYKMSEIDFTELKLFIHKHFNIATLKYRNTKNQLENALKELKKRQSALIKKNIDFVISNEILKSELEDIEVKRLEIFKSLANIPDTYLDIDNIIQFCKDYITSPSQIWQKAGIIGKIRLQRFQFPCGVIFENNQFRTPEICSLFKLKSFFLTQLSPKVDSSDKISNTTDITNSQFLSKFYNECIELHNILKENSKNLDM